MNNIEKLKMYTDKQIEEMNKEEIKKRIKVVEKDECDKCYFPKKRSCRSCIKQSYKEIKRYIKELEQKKSILDKVTDKLKEDIENAEKGKDTNIMLIKEYYRNKKEYAQEILNIIESK